MRSGEPSTSSEPSGPPVLLILVLVLFVVARLLARQRTGGRSGADGGVAAPEPGPGLDLVVATRSSGSGRSRRDLATNLSDPAKEPAIARAVP